MPIYRLNLKPGEIRNHVIGGTYLQYVDGPSPIKVRKNGGSWDELWIGTGTGREEYTSFETENPSSAEIVVFLWCSDVEFIDRRRNQIEAPTEFAPVADVAGVYVAGVLAAGQNLDLTGAAPAGRIRRKAVQIVNLDPAVNLLLQDSAGRTGLIVGPGKEITQPVSGFMRVRNPAGAGVACHVSEIWWLP